MMRDGLPPSFEELLALPDGHFLAAWSDHHDSYLDAPISVRARAIERYRKLTGEGSRRRMDDGPQPRVASESDLWPSALDLAALAEHDPQPPRFIVQDWLPCGYATLLAGHGGAGKSQVALMLAVCIASGERFLGMRTERRRVLFLSCEDRADVLHWRLRRICEHLGIDLAALAGWLEVLDLVGHDAVLWKPDPRTGHAITASFGALAERMRHGEVLIVDGVADVYGGNENARAEVKQFVNALVGLIPADRGALVLIGHVNRVTATTAATTEGYSGSTGWHNAVRARWYLRADKGEDVAPGELVLDLQKSNLGNADRSIRLRWDAAAHLFTGEAVEETHFDRRLRERDELAGVLDALRASETAGVSVPAANSGPRTAYHVLSARPELPDSLRGGGTGRRRFWRAVELLRQSGEVRVETVRTGHRKEIEVLRCANAPMVRE